jgi:RNA-directed DNA polymerase
LSAAYIAAIVRTATHRYKTYQIPKAAAGLRTIDHPARELKFLQIWLVDNIIAHLPVHSAAFAYRKRRNILAHAQVHVAQNYLLKVDLREFFPSITGQDVSGLLRANALLFTPALDTPDYGLARSLVCKNDRLTIGAPSSPALSKKTTVGTATAGTVTLAMIATTTATREMWPSRLV